MQMQKCQNLPLKCRPLQIAAQGGRPPSPPPFPPPLYQTNTAKGMSFSSSSITTVNSVTTFTDKFCCVTATDIIKNKTVLYWDNIFA